MCKEFFQIAIGSVLICIILVAVAMGETVSREKIIRDDTVTAPGFGSDSILLSEDIDSVLNRFGRYKFKISKPRNPGELFKNVFNVDSKKKIFFESIYYHEEKKYAVCVFQEKVIAIIGFDNNRVTTDLVNLRSGINDFIYNYGNRNLQVLRSDSNGIYLYPDRGIAVVDDGMNDSIDLYVIFKANSSNKK